MKKTLAFLRRLLFAITVLAKAVMAPVATVVKQTLYGDSISIGQLGFALWRLIVWLSFLMCAMGSIGVPAMIAYLFLCDLLIVGIQTVFITTQPQEVIA